MKQSFELNPPPPQVVALRGDCQKVMEVLLRLGRLSYAELRDESHLTMRKVKTAVNQLCSRGLVTTAVQREVGIVIPI